MLSSENLKSIFGVDFPLNPIQDIHWRSQDSNSQSLLFYKVGNDEKEEELFHQRITKSEYSLLVINREIKRRVPNSIVVNESEWPKIQNEILNKLYPVPDIKLIGITGTNGKTTTADLVLQLGFLMGKKGMSIGTLGVREYNKTLLDFGLTTPSFIDLRKFLHRYGKDKDFCVMEASSHALIQDRMYDLRFDAAGWLSFSQDHLDYHQSMDEYFKAKCLIFNHLKSTSSLFVPFEQQELFQKLTRVSNHTKFSPVIEKKLPLFFSTQFNKNNLEVAQAIVENVFQLKFQGDYGLLQAPDGRFYIQSYRSNYIVVDFAHTPDALENICLGIKQTFPGHKLKVLFGCGGDRDRGKRPLMAEVVSRYAEEIYLTSDNPRSENPDQIISDILIGVKCSHYQTITDRPEAVKIAFSELKENEVLLLAGKGHEDYILIHGVKHPYSDIREVQEFIARNKI